MARSATRRFLCLLLTASSLACAQELKVPDSPEVVHIAPEPSERFPARWYSGVGDGTDVVSAPVLDRPYVAGVEAVTLFQSLPGEPLRRVEHNFAARDRFGRTRSESQNGAETIGEEMMPLKDVVVDDPVSHCHFHWVKLASGDDWPSNMWDTHHLAFVRCGPQMLRYKDLGLFETLLDTSGDGTTTEGDTVTTTEHLAPLQIDGLTIVRRRVSSIRPDGQGQVKKSSDEQWYSPELKELVRLGDEESDYTGLTNIRRIDPDPKLFYPPDGYRIQLQPDSRTAPKD